MTGPGLHVVERPGVGPPIVLVHGSLDRSATFARVAGADALAGLHVVRYDRRGYGRSADSDSDPGHGSGGRARGVGLAGHVEDLLGLVERLGAGPAVVVGHSFGGLVGLAAACRAPERVAAVGAFEAPLPWSPWWPATTAGGAAVRADPEGAAEAFLTRMIGAERWAGLPEGTKRARRREGAALVAELASVRPPAPGGPPPLDPSAVPVPVLAGRGSASSAHLRRAAEELAAAAGCELVEIDGADHGAHLTHAEDFAREVVARTRALVGAPHPGPRGAPSATADATG